MNWIDAFRCAARPQRVHLVAAVVAVVASISIATLPTEVAGQVVPSIPVALPGVCPESCCAYGQIWTATSSVNAFSSPPPITAPPVFTVQTGEQVTAVRGVVMVTHAPPITLRDPSALNVLRDGSTRPFPFPARAGAHLGLLWVHEDGLSTVWYEGEIVERVHARFLPAPACAEALHDGGCAGELAHDGGPRHAWFIEVRNAHGRTGWVQVTEDLWVRPRCD